MAGDRSKGLDLTPIWVRKAPPWILSGILHALFILIASVVVFSETQAEVRPALVVHQRPDIKVQESLLPPDVVDKPEIEAKVKVPEPSPVEPEIEDPKKVEPPGDPESRTSVDHPDTPILGPGDGSTLPPGIRNRDRGKREGGQRVQLQRGLHWLARHQSPDGSWSSHGFQAHCKDGKCSGPGFEGYDVGVTALALMAFTGTGNTPWHGDHRDTVRKATRWLVRQQAGDGAIGRTKSEGWMYNHALATMALCEVRAMSGPHVHSLRRPTQAAIDFCLRSQNPGNGWRYESRSGDNDTSVTGWMVLALKAGRIANAKVPDSSFQSARKWLDRVTGPGGVAGYRGTDGASSYLASQAGSFEPAPTMTAVSVLCRRLTGQSRKDRVIRDGVNVLMEFLPDARTRHVNHYYWYYGTYALFQSTRGPSDPIWKRWNRAVTVALISTQRDAVGEEEYGSWDPIGEWGIAGGRVYSTAINLLTLEATFRYERLK